MEHKKKNQFYEGCVVVCTNDNFPWLQRYGGVGQAADRPKLNEVLTVDEVLGEFLRFACYDTPESFNWWHHTRFSPARYSQKTTEMLMKVVESAYHED